MTHEKGKYARSVWNQLAGRYSDDTTVISELWDEIELSYSQRGRHYHTLEHIEFMLRKFFELKEKISEPDILLFSIFYHDIIYNVRREDNELQSAELAAKRLAKLKASKELIDRCKFQIRATKHHMITSDSDTNYLLDLDLAILGESAEKYKEYSKNIRSEYLIYPYFLYKKGRSKVLKHFLEMPVIFKTDDFQELYETRAKQNLKEELVSL